MRGISIVIPAFDEGSVIDDCLRSLAAQSFDGELDVIVVANGCSDDTARRASGFGPALERRGDALTVIEQERPSKPEALNRGDRAARHPDRVYLDPDVTLSPTALADIAVAFAAGVPFCSPRLQARAVGRFGDAYRQVWTRLPYVAGDVVGAGLYAVSAAGRARWEQFPNIVADDKFARLHFARHERRVLGASTFTVVMPAGFAELVRVRSRWIRANRQLRRECPGIAAREPRRLSGMPAFPLLMPAVWRHLPPFLLVYLAAEIRSRATDARGQLGQLGPWERSVRARVDRALAS